MAIASTRAIVIRRRELRETSLIVTFYTKERGKIHGVLKGVRGIRAEQWGGSLEPLSCVDIVYYEKRGTDLYLVSQCELVEYFHRLRLEYDRLVYALYLVDLLDSLTEPNDANSDIYDLLVSVFGHLSGGASPKRMARIFELRLLTLVGHEPLLDRCALCGKKGEGKTYFSMRHGGLICVACSALEETAFPVLRGTIEFMRHILSGDLEKIYRIKVAEQVGRELEALMKRFIAFQFENRIKTAEFMLAVDLE